MKKLVSAIVLSLFAFQSYSQEVLPGLATDIGVGANGSAWVTGTDFCEGDGYGIYYWNENQYNWIKVFGCAVALDVDKDGVPYVINSRNQIFKRKGSEITNPEFGDPSYWSVLPGLGIDIGVGANNNIWLIGTNGCVYYWNTNTNNWTHEPTPFNNPGRIDCDIDNIVYVTLKSDDPSKRYVYQKKPGEQWVRVLDGLANDVSCGPLSVHNTFITQTNSYLSRYHPCPTWCFWEELWPRLEGIVLSVGRNNFWTIKSGNIIMRY
jgi:hypothetical protein